MTHILDDIKKAEKKAAEIIENAKKEADDLVGSARDQKDQKVASVEAEEKKEFENRHGKLLNILERKKKEIQEQQTADEQALRSKANDVIGDAILFVTEKV